MDFFPIGEIGLLFLEKANILQPGKTAKGGQDDPGWPHHPAWAPQSVPSFSLYSVTGVNMPRKKGTAFRFLGEVS